MWLYSWIHAGTLARAAALVAKCSTERSSNSRVEYQASMTALSSAYPANILLFLYGPVNAFGLCGR